VELFVLWVFRNFFFNKKEDKKEDSVAKLFFAKLSPFCPLNLFKKNFEKFIKQKFPHFFHIFCISFSTPNFFFRNPAEIPQKSRRNPAEIPQKSRRNPAEIPQKSRRNPAEIPQHIICYLSICPPLLVANWNGLCFYSFVFFSTGWFTALGLWKAPRWPFWACFVALKQHVRGFARGSDPEYLFNFIRCPWLLAVNEGHLIYDKTKTKNLPQLRQKISFI